MASVEDPPPLKEEIEISQEHAKDPESGDEDDEDLKKGVVVATDELPLRESRFKLPFAKNELAFNPAVSLIGLVPLWALTGYCISSPDEASSLLNTWFSQVTDAFTWFYIGTFHVLCCGAVWCGFVMYFSNS